MDTRPAHVECLNGLNADGTLTIAGPFLDADGKPCGSLVVVKAETIEEAAARSPPPIPMPRPVSSKSVEVKAWNWVFNKPEA